MENEMKKKKKKRKKNSKYNVVVVIELNDFIDCDLSTDVYAIRTNDTIHSRNPLWYNNTRNLLNMSFSYRFLSLRKFLFI